MDKATAEKLIKKVLPTFNISGEVGKGAFGAVYKIQDELKERVAKIVPLHAAASVENGAVVDADTKIERDFRHIIESYERIACEEIVTVYDFYKVVLDEEAGKGRAYALVVMELYPSSLDRYIISHYERLNRPVEIRVAQNVMEKVARMLGNLYTKMGFLFEDFKPENILIKEFRGDLKVVVGDIGGLKNVVSIALTASQVTPSYCAPEIIRQAQPPDLRSIVYSYGLLCFFILEGNLPYSDKPITTRFDMVRSSGIPFTRKDIPETMIKTIAKCLVFDPAQRFTDFETIVKALKGEVPLDAPAALDDFSAGTIVTPVRAAAAPAPVSDFDSATIVTGGRPQPPTPSGSLGVPGRTVTVGGTTRVIPSALKSGPPQKSGGVEAVSISDEKKLVESIDREIPGQIVKSGETLKINDEACRVTGNIVIHKNAVLSLYNAKLFFAENTGVVVIGSIRAKDSLFSAIEAGKKWNNLTLVSSPTSPISQIENCRFHFGRGVSGKNLNATFRISRPTILESGFYGGGLFVAGGTDKSVVLKQILCYKCTASDGGGLYLYQSGAIAETCTFEGCTAMGSGGAVYALESKNTLRQCTFNRCSSGREGGGLHCQASPLTVDNGVFRNCIARVNGGGIACVSSSPDIKGCKFEMCTAAKAGGAIYGDRQSKPKISFQSYLKCKPNDASVEA